MSTISTSRDRLFSIACHACTLFGISMVSIAVPIGVLFVSDNEAVKDNIWFWAAVIGGVYGFLSFITFGLLGLILFPMVAFGFLWHAFWSVMAIIHALSSNKPYRYPFIIRIL
jgi:uncharacterized protein